MGWEIHDPSMGVKPIIKTLFLSQVLIIYVNLVLTEEERVRWVSKSSCITAKALLRLLNEANTHGHFRASHVQITQNINLTMNYLKIQLNRSLPFVFQLLPHCILLIFSIKLIARAPWKKVEGVRSEIEGWILHI